jgi:hypothetical protein
VIRGDLDEQYRQGRSAAWYWRQVLAAIVLDNGGELRRHPLRAVITCLCGYALLFALNFAGNALHQSMGKFVWNWTVEHEWDTLRVLWFGRPYVPGLPRHVSSLLSCVGTGWVIARLNGRHHTAMVVTFCSTVVLVNLWTFHRALGDPYGVKHPAALLAGVVVMFVVMPMCILTGGIAMQLRRRQPEVHA